MFFFCSHWSLVDVPLIFFCPPDHVPDWQPRVLLGMVEARSVNVKKTTTTTDSSSSEGSSTTCVLLTLAINLSCESCNRAVANSSYSSNCCTAVLLKHTLGNAPPRVLFEAESRPPNAWSSKAALSLAILLIVVAPHLNRRAISPWVTFSLNSPRIAIFWPKLSRVRDLLFQSDACFLLVQIFSRPRVLSALRLPVLVDLPPLDEPVAVAFTMDVWQMRCIGSSLSGSSTSPHSPWRRPPHTPRHKWPSGAYGVRS